MHTEGMVTLLVFLIVVACIVVGDMRQQKWEYGGGKEAAEVKLRATLRRKYGDQYKYIP
jgi:hypothetical protein